MDFNLSPAAADLRDRAERFFTGHILPRHPEWQDWMRTHDAGDPPFLAELKVQAQAEGLYQFPQPSTDVPSPSIRLS